MSDLQKAFTRVSNAVKKALEGVDGPMSGTAEDDEGNEQPWEKIPLAKIQAGDTKALCLAIPPDKKTDVVRALFKGVRDLPPTLIVQQQTTCLSNLLSVFKKYVPSESMPEIPEAVADGQAK